MPHQKILPPTTAFLLAVMAYFLFTVADSMGKWLQGGYSAAQILVTTNIVALIIMVSAAFIWRGRKEAFYSTHWRLHAVRGCLIATMAIFVLYAVKDLPLAQFYGIIFLGPIWVALISRVFLKQIIPPSRWIAIGTGFLGVLIIAGAEFANFNLNAVAALCASIMGATAAILARQIGSQEAPTNFSVATHIAIIIFNTPLLIGNYIQPSLADLGLMTLYGVVISMAIMSITFVFARSHVVSQIAPLQYTQMVWAVLIGWLVFHNEPTPNVFAGSILVVGAGLYILRSLRRGRIMNH